MDTESTELLQIFTDKDFKFNYVVQWTSKALEAKNSVKMSLLKRFFDHDKFMGTSAILRSCPKNYKSFAKFEKDYKKWANAKVKEQDRRIKKGEGKMTNKEWHDGMPKFISTLKPKDIRIIFVARNCRTWKFCYDELTVKKFKNIISSLL